MLSITDEENAIKCLLKKDWSDKRIVLYGAGYCGFETITLFRNHGIQVDMVCDDNRAGEYIEGIKISSIEDVAPGNNLVIFITSGFNERMKTRLKELGLYKYYHEIDFGRYDATKECPEYFKEHIGELERAYNLLKDKSSSF